MEEFIRSISAPDTHKGKNPSAQAARLFYSAPGPRARKIIAQAKAAGIPCEETGSRQLDALTASLSGNAREHRGLVLKAAGIPAARTNLVDLEAWAKSAPEQATVIMLDSVTDPHNVGAILRSCDQFGASLAILPERRGVKDATSNEVVARSSAGASAWVPVAAVPNLSRAIQVLKDAGFWVYGADAGGTSVTQAEFPPRTAIVMGSEGSGISRLLRESCDALLSIPTCGRLDSLNVSVAAGIMLHEVRRQQMTRQVITERKACGGNAASDILQDTSGQERPNRGAQ